MDNFNESSPKVTPSTNNEEEDIDNNCSSAPPLLPPNLEPTLQPGTAEPFNPGDNNENINVNANNNQNPRERENRNRRRRRNKNRYKASTCRKVFQIIGSILLYSIAILSIIFQIFYGINIGLIDDIAMIVLATIMIIYTKKGKSTAQCQIGCLTLSITFIGFGIRGGSCFMVKKEMTKYFYIILSRTLILFFMTSFNCNRSEELVIRY